MKKRKKTFKPSQQWIKKYMNGNVKKITMYDCKYDYYVAYNAKNESRRIFNASTGRCISACPDGKGKPYRVNLVLKNGKKIKVLLHRIVAYEFLYLPNAPEAKIGFYDPRIPFKDLVVHHIDHNNRNNNGWNLDILPRKIHDDYHHKNRELYVLVDVSDIT